MDCLYELRFLTTNESCSTAGFHFFCTRYQFFTNTERKKSDSEFFKDGFSSSAIFSAVFSQHFFRIKNADNRSLTKKLLTETAEKIAELLNPTLKKFKFRLFFFPWQHSIQPQFMQQMCNSPHPRIVVAIRIYSCSWWLVGGWQRDATVQDN